MTMQGETRVEVPVPPGDRIKVVGVLFIREDLVAAAFKAIEELAKAGLMQSELLFAIHEIRFRIGLEVKT